MHATILGHDNVLVKYTMSGSETVRYLSIATLSPSDQDFIAGLNQAPLAKLPFTCTLTDSAGKETAVNLIAHNDDWAQCALVSDGTMHYVYLPSLMSSDQAVVRLLPGGLNFKFPMDYVFTGSPKPDTKVQLLGRNDNTVEYLDLIDGQRYFTSISDLSSADQSFVREFPPYKPDDPRDALFNRPSATTNSSAPRLVKNNLDPNSPLDSSMLNALVIIKGDYCEGSGFIAKLHDQYFIVTNQHVLSGNKDFTITTMDGNNIPTTGPLYGAVNYDVAILKIPDVLAKNYLEVMADPQTNSKTGDRVTVCGNSLGAGVPSQVNGELLAIGPELVEVSAQLQHGISGSPIIDRPTESVIGIATMSITYKIDTYNSGFTSETRWFGYRVDNISPEKGWVKMDWVRFRDEGIKVCEAVDLYKSLDAVLTNRNTVDITSPLVQSAIDSFQSELSLAKGRKSDSATQDAFRTFCSKLRSLADNGTTELSKTKLFPYHAKTVKDLETVRKYMDQAFEDTNRKFENLVTAGR